MSTKKLLGLLLITAIIVLLLTGCGLPQPNPDNELDPVPGEEEEINPFEEETGDDFSLYNSPGKPQVLFSV